MKLTALRIVLPVAVFLCLSDCVLAEAVPALKTEVRLWHQWRAEKLEPLESVVEDFNCGHEGIRVLAEPLGPMSGTVAERMLLGSTAVKLPDLALVEREAIPLLADAGAIRPLDKLIERSPTLRRENLLDSARSYGTYDGKLYGLPARLNPLVLIYNPELLTEAGISTPPRDWNGFVSLARTISAKGRWVLSVRAMAPLFNILCVQRGVNPLDADASPEHSAAILEMLTFIRGLRQTPSLLPPQYKFWDPNFIGVAGGKVFFQIDDAEMLAYMLKSAPAPLAVGTMPSDSGPSRTSLSGSQVFVVSSSSGDASAAMEFLEIFYSPEHYSAFADKLLFVPPVKSALPSVEKAVSNGSIYSQLVRAAENAEALPLSQCAGTKLSEIARAVEKLDAGLISSERALDEVLHASKSGECEQSFPTYSPVQVTWAESTRRLFASDVPDSHAPPVELVAVRNEHETFQLAISAERRIEGLSVDIAPFVSEDGASYNFKTVSYLETDTLVSVPLVAEKAGPYPNVLKRQGKFDIEPGKLTRIWVDVFVPADVPAGALSSQIVIRQHPSDVARIPVRLRVLPLTLPTAPSQPAVIGLNYDLIAKHYDVEKRSEASRKLKDLFFWFMVEHRLSPYQPPVPPNSPEVAPYVKDERVSACRLPFAPADPRFERAVLLAKEGGWLDKLFAYFIDEPTYHQYDAIISAGKKIHSMSAPPKFLVTCFPDKPLLGAVDIWCIHMRFLPEGLPRSFTDRRMYADAVRRRLEAGDEVWWYTAGGVKPFPTLQIEDAPAAFRIIPWLQQFYGIDGFLHWEAANWSQPLDEAFVKHFGNGEGVLVYPGDSQPSPSIRLELLREGLEDMECLMLLRRSIEAVQKDLGAEWLGDVASVRVREMCRRLFSEEALRAHAANGLFLLPHFVREPGSIERVREEVVKETVALAERPVALVLTEPEEKQYTDSANVRLYGQVQPGCKVEINGHEQGVDTAGRFSAQLPLSSGTNIFFIRVERGQYSRTIVRKIEKF